MIVNRGATTETGTKANDLFAELLDDEETVHNAFFDRNYKEEANED